MGFPYDTGSYEGVSGAIFMGFGTSMPGMFTVIAIVVAVVLLAAGQATEAAKYRDHKYAVVNQKSAPSGHWRGAFLWSM